MPMTYYRAAFSAVTGKTTLHAATCPNAQKRSGRVTFAVAGCTITEARESLAEWQEGNASDRPPFTVCRCAR